MQGADIKELVPRQREIPKRVGGAKAERGNERLNRGAPLVYADVLLSRMVPCLEIGLRRFLGHCMLWRRAGVDAIEFVVGVVVRRSVRHVWALS